MVDSPPLSVAPDEAEDEPDAGGLTAADSSVLDAELTHDASEAWDATASMDAAPNEGPVDASSVDAVVTLLDASLRDGSLPDATLADASTPTDARVDATLPDASIPPEQALYSSFTRVYAILDQSCNNSCHRPGAAYSLDLSTRELSYLELIGGENKGAREWITCANQGLFRVVPGKPAESVLIQKLENKQTCGDRMPPGGSLSTTAIAEIRAWISRGAPDD